MTAADFGETDWRQIDRKKWTLTRRRAKTGDNPRTPTVTYKLWPETIGELERLSHREGLLFLTSTEQPLYQTKYKDDGGVAIKDLFSHHWQRLDGKPAIPLGKFRSVGATALKSDKMYRQYQDYFLAHASKTVGDQYYGAEVDGPFFEALEHIRRVLGFTA